MKVSIKVISLATAAERRKQFTEAAADTALSWEFFDAHRGAAPFLVNDVAGQNRLLGRELEPAELGCYSSHAGVWKEFLESDADLLFVFEDDVAIDWNYIAFLAEHDYAAADIHYLRLFAKVPSRFHRVKAGFLSVYYHLVQNSDFPSGTQAYLVTRSGAERFLKHCTTILRAIDNEMDRSWDHGIPNLQILPAPVFERFIASSIGDQRLTRMHDAKPDRIAKMVDRLRRVKYRLTDRFELKAVPQRTGSPASHP